MSRTTTSYSSAMAHAYPSYPFETRSAPQRCYSKPRLTNCPTVGSSSITRILIGAGWTSDVEIKRRKCVSAFPPNLHLRHSPFNDAERCARSANEASIRPLSGALCLLLLRQERHRCGVGPRLHDRTAGTVPGYDSVFAFALVIDRARGASGTKQPGRTAGCRRGRHAFADSS